MSHKSAKSASRAAGATTERLLVNPIDCQAHGACAELLPEMITLDEWGYPIVDSGPLPPGLERHARKAVNACPTLALRLLRTEAQ